MHGLPFLGPLFSRAPQGTPGGETVVMFPRQVQSHLAEKAMQFFLPRDFQ
jgi:hypothetical protein